MDGIISILATLVLGVAFGAVVGFFLKKSGADAKSREAEAEAEKLLTLAKKDSANILKEAELTAKETALKAKTEGEQAVTERKRELDEFERRLLHREGMLDKKADQADRREEELSKKDLTLNETRSALAKKEEEVSRTLLTHISKLEEISGMTSTEAKEELKTGLVNTARIEAAGTVKKLEEKARKGAEEEARQLVSQSIQRISNDMVAENTVSIVDLPSEEMKGRIIGREGRNIRSLEVATGVDLIIDDTPNAVILSCFNPVKREVARLTLMRLIKDGRIHPGRIEDTVEKVTKEVNAKIREVGEHACDELGLDGIHPEIVKLLGRLKYRTSYSQNVLNHSVEVALLAGMMAAELGQNQKLARRAGLLHDIGKAVDQDMEGTHVQIGADLARKYNEHKVVINSILSHHEDEPPESIIAELVSAADTLSASRPGARREMLQNYIKRMRKLEEIGDSFEGVDRTYAIQAGREVRVVVEPSAIHDNEAFFLAKDIAQKIQDEMVYPGEIKVTVIRETRITDFAR
ncbi:Ribonuclease Y [hydrothermal vent metagenome]|uniref:Ribonuclease Y n=1 Tax=hydrothermal vent metagenome TaxID=652676 RepID=A0A3B1C9Q5_9ZZZZ